MLALNKSFPALNITEWAYLSYNHQTMAELHYCGVERLVSPEEDVGRRNDHMHMQA